MNSFFQKMRLALSDGILRRRILFVAGAFILFRMLAAVPIPGINEIKLAALLEGNQFLGLFNIFSGGGLDNLSIVMLGVGPYITASIIMQLLTMIFPKLKQLYHEEGELGRKKFAQYSRLLTLPLALLSSFGFLVLLSRQGVLGEMSAFSSLVNMCLIVAGSFLLMWIGELVTEFGIGSGVSLIIFAGIVSSIPKNISAAILSFDASQIPLYAAFIVAALVIIYGVVFVSEAERPVPVTYAKRVRGMRQYGGVSTYLPLRVNQAGVIPIIFALSILLFPQMILSFFNNAANPLVQSVASILLKLFSSGWFYSTVYFILVLIFTYFYTAVTFEPESVATNLQKNGAFVPGVRPGRATAEYLSHIVTRITLVGAVFLAVVAVLPLLMQSITGNTSLAIGGTALLIVVSVVLDLVKKIEAQVAMREY
jgi:preprotein translocase subunit SecY